jgi:hypothetical protein
MGQFGTAIGGTVSALSMGQENDHDPLGRDDERRPTTAPYFTVFKN